MNLSILGHPQFKRVALTGLKMHFIMLKMLLYCASFRKFHLPKMNPLTGDRSQVLAEVEVCCITC